MNKRFLGAATIFLLVVAGVGVAFLGFLKSDEREGIVEGTKQSQLVQVRTLTIRTVNGETLEFAPNVLVYIDEQIGEQTQGRESIHQALRSNESGIAVFQLPQGDYTLRSGSAEWYGVLNVRLEQNAELYLNLHSLTE
ncbi:MAG: hypothetical protein WCV86_04585 [Patescibacteria group bacterium]